MNVRLVSDLKLMSPLLCLTQDGASLCAALYGDSVESGWEKKNSLVSLVWVLVQ